jgi:hypothetical protein
VTVPSQEKSRYPSLVYITKSEKTFGALFIGSSIL